MTRVGGWLPALGMTLAQAANPAMAQIATDGSANSDFHGPVPFDGSNYDIRAEIGRRAGDNLFHSFEWFSLRNGESATFRGPAAIRNVISRVTGGERSRINGTIASRMPNADFFFLNPAGVVFGPNAFLDVQGSFHVSTADELRFSDGELFSARLSGTSSFTVAAPEAFGFLDHGAGRISVNGTDELLVAPDETFSLVGGDISIDHSLIVLGDLETRNGNVTLVAMSRPGAVAIANGRSSATPQGEIRVTGEERNPEGQLRHGLVVSSEAGGGVVRIRAGALVVESAFIFADNLRGESGTATALIDIEADRVRLTRGAEVTSIAFGEGDAGDVVVRAGELDVLSGASLRSDTASVGNAGTVSVLDARRVLVSGESQGRREQTAISSSVARLFEDSPPATGNAGAVTVQADEITVRDSGAIFSISRDDSEGDAGTVAVEADRIMLLAGGQVGSGTLEQSTGRGGDATVTARELVIDGQSTSRINPRTNRPEPSGIFASTESESAEAGRGGTATVTAPVIRLADRGEIASESVGGGPGGNVLVTADSLVIDDAEITTKAEGAGDGGRIRVRAGALELRNRGLITAQSTGAGATGAVTLEVGDRLLLLEGSEISTDSTEAGGGRIRVRVGDAIVLRDSFVTTSVEGGTDRTAGNITIDPKVLVIDGGKIQANANAPTGFGGRVRIVADNVLVPGGDFQTLLDRGDISASGGTQERAGTVTVNSPDVDLSGGFVVLEGALLDAASQLRERCASRRDIGASSFTGVGRGGLPPSPDAPLFGAYVVDEVAAGEAQKAGSRPSPGTVPASVRLAGLSAPCVPLD